MVHRPTSWSSMTDLITMAYRIKRYQISGPNWLGSRNDSMSLQSFRMVRIRETYRKCCKACFRTDSG